MQPHRWPGVVGLALVLTTGAAWIQAQQASPATPPPTGVIAGQVVDGSSNRGVSDAIVALSGASAPDRPGPAPASGQPRVITDNDGRFFFTSVRPGSYNLSVIKAGYLPASFGQRVPVSQGTTLDITTGQHRLDLKIAVWKLATIAGSVLDESEEPVVGATVQVMRRVYRGGVPAFSSGGSATTDDRGMFRISTLQPGSYIVAVPSIQTTLPVALLEEQAQSGGPRSELSTVMFGATPVIAPPGSVGNQRMGDHILQVQQRGITPPAASPSGELHVYPTTFHPATTRAIDAAAITIESGAERSGVDIRVKPVRTVRVSGTLVWPGGSGAPTAITLVPRSGGGSGEAAPDLGSGFEAATTVADATGRFTMLGVPPGSYTLRVHRTSAREPSAASGLLDPAWWADEPVAVGAADINDLSIALRPGHRVSGRVEFVGSIAPPDPARARVELWLESLDAHMRSSTQTAMFAEPDGRFVSRALPAGRYRLVVTGGSFAGWTLKSAMSGARDLSDTPFDLKDADIADIVVTFTDAPSRLIGTVRDDRGAATSEAMVIVLPANRNEWTGWGAYPRRLADRRATSSGTYAFLGLAPGSYLIAALPLERYEWTPTFFEAVSRVATRVDVADGQARTTDLRVTPVRR